MTDKTLKLLIGIVVAENDLTIGHLKHFQFQMSLPEQHRIAELDPDIQDQVDSLAKYNEELEAALSELQQMYKIEKPEWE
jgi:hypothetical protein